MHGRLYLDFCGEEITLEPGSRLTFGRCGDLVVDDNPYLHRVVGVFEERGGAWWVANLGRRVALVVTDANSPSTIRLGAGGATGLRFGEFSIRFCAGPTNYELIGALEEHEWGTDLLGADGVDGLATLDWAHVDLNADQRLLLLALCEAHLRDPLNPDHPVPTSRSAANRLGWSMPKFNRKLDHLAEKLARAGVRGVQGVSGASATDRRRTIIEHALTNSLVSVHELGLLDATEAAA